MEEYGYVITVLRQSMDREELAERIAFWGGSVEMAELELEGER